jgi:hypothetical protein
VVATTVRHTPLSLLSVALCLGTGCATYDEKTCEARELYFQGQYEASANEWEALKAEEEDLAPLIDLELGMVNFAAGNLEASSRSLEAADQVLQIIDFTSDPAEWGKYVFSEDSGICRARPYEKVFLSALNLLSYAERGKLAEARTEANLLYSKVDGIRQIENTTQYDSALVYLLVGLLDEIAEPSRPDVALIAYERALASLPSKTIEDVVERLRRAANQRVPANSELASDQGELVVFVLNGRGPVLKEFDEYTLTEEEKAYFNDIVLTEVIARVTAAAAQAMTEQQISEYVMLRLMIPKLKLAVMRKQPSTYSSVDLTVSGNALGPLEKVLDLEKQILDWFETVRGRILAAAISRVAFRVAAGLTSEILLRKEAKNGKAGNDNMQNNLAAIVGLLVEGGLYLMDTPDTRCWCLLPREVFWQRTVLKAGTYEIRATLGSQNGGQKELPPKMVTVPAKGFGFAVWICHD